MAGSLRSDDPEKLINAITDLIKLYPTGEPVIDQAKFYISVATGPYVYEKYEPTEGPTGYKRRKQGGGLADVNMYESYTEVGDNWSEIHVKDERHEVWVVEAGRGYQWEGSRIYAMQPFPRPYFKLAEEHFAVYLEYEIKRLCDSL